jgi:hypothetical protein
MKTKFVKKHKNEVCKKKIIHENEVRKKEDSLYSRKKLFIKIVLSWKRSYSMQLIFCDGVLLLPFFFMKTDFSSENEVFFSE